MQATNPISIVEQPFSPVKSSPPVYPVNTPDSMIHHKVSPNPPQYIVVTRKNLSSPPYGVSQSQRILTKDLLLKKYDQVRDCLAYCMKLSVSEREVVLRLLRFWAYYGQVYPKESTITNDPGCSKATFWRTIRLLKELGFISVTNRYVIRPHAQISNLYRFDRLLIVIARYLAEHGVGFWEKWLQPYFSMPGSLFWRSVTTRWADRSPPMT